MPAPPLLPLFFFPRQAHFPDFLLFPCIPSTLPSTDNHGSTPPLRAAFLVPGHGQRLLRGPATGKKGGRERRRGGG